RPTSAAISKSSACTRTRTSVRFPISAPRHGRKERHLAVRRKRRIVSDMLMVDCDPDHFLMFQRGCVAVSARLEQCEQVGHRFHSGGQVHCLGLLADTLAYPGEIDELHGTTPR